MPRYAPVMSLDDFKSLLIDFGKEHGDEDYYLDEDEYNPTEIIRWALIEEKFSDAINDMSKISFDFENLDVEKFTTLSNGVPIAYMRAGGDWEHPIYFALYYDGKKFRAYVPTKTNYYNHGTKTAYGNDDRDFADSKKHYGVKTEQEFLDFEFTEKDHIADFEKRIEVKGTYTYKGKNITPKSVLKKQEQSTKEVTFPKTGPIVTSDLSVCVMPAALGSYVQFHTRESGRELNESELSRIVGVPKELERGGTVWYSNKSSKELADFMIRRGYTIHPQSYLCENEIRTIYMGRP